MGRSAYSRSAFEARNRHRRDQREQIHGASEKTALADLEDLSHESYQEHGFDRLLYGADDPVSGPVCVSGAGTRPSTDSPLCRDRASDSGMEYPATPGGLSLGHRAAVSAAGS